jgi:hypothetical protein
MMMSNKFSNHKITIKKAITTIHFKRKGDQNATIFGYNKVIISTKGAFEIMVAKETSRKQGQQH